MGMSPEEIEAVLKAHTPESDDKGGVFENIKGERKVLAKEFKLQEADSKIDTRRISIDLEVVEGEKDAGRHIFNTIYLSNEKGYTKLANVINTILGKKLESLGDIEKLCGEIEGSLLNVKGWEKNHMKLNSDGNWEVDKVKNEEKGKKQMVSFLGLAEAKKPTTPF